MVLQLVLLAAPAAALFGRQNLELSTFDTVDTWCQQSSLDDNKWYVSQKRRTLTTCLENAGYRHMCEEIEKACRGETSDRCTMQNETHKGFLSPLNPWEKVQCRNDWKSEASTFVRLAAKHYGARFGWQRYYSEKNIKKLAELHAQRIKDIFDAHEFEAGKRLMNVFKKMNDKFYVRGNKANLDWNQPKVLRWVFRELEINHKITPYAEKYEYDCPGTATSLAGYSGEIFSCDYENYYYTSKGRSSDPTIECWNGTWTVVKTKIDTSEGALPIDNEPVVDYIPEDVSIFCTKTT